MSTETLDKLYLEWSQFTGARTAREIAMAKAAKWQPIESAPRDGTHVLVGTFPAPAGHVTTTTAHWFDGGWALSVNYDAEHSDHGVSHPTHWMPPPPPPE